MLLLAMGKSHGLLDELFPFIRVLEMVTTKFKAIERYDINCGPSHRLQYVNDQLEESQTFQGTFPGYQ